MQTREVGLIREGECYPDEACGAAGKDPLQTSMHWECPAGEASSYSF
jgi:hypothetical protein